MSQSHAHDHGHDHDHDHDHTPTVTSANERKVLLSFFLIFGFMVVEAVGGVLSGSLALLADAGHMLTDAAALALAYAAFRFGRRAADGKLGIEEMTGGTFSISNGGVFGSMLSTPIINPPQSAILGVHATKERPVVENGQIVIRPMNYLAMSYDHRIIDGREAVLGLVAMKEALEDPQRLLLDL